MNIPHIDSVVIFGATGDLVYKKIYPALYAMERRGHLQAPVIGVARSDWTNEKFRARARASVEKQDSAIRRVSKWSTIRTGMRWPPTSVS